MKKRVWKLCIDFQREEAWLNKMSAKGYALTGFCLGLYTFEASRPGKYIYRIELLKQHPGHSESQSYLEFMAEAGVEVVATWWRWVFFRKEAACGNFEIYSDIESLLEHYRRVALLLLSVFCLQFSVALRGLCHISDALHGVRGPGNMFQIAMCLPAMLIGAALFAVWLRVRRKMWRLKRENKVRE